MKQRKIKLLGMLIALWAYSGNVAANDTLSFAWYGDTRSYFGNVFYISVTKDKPFIIDFGDGNTTTMIGGTKDSSLPEGPREDIMFVNHHYANGSYYVVTVIGLTNDCYFTYLSFERYLNSLDVSKCDKLKELICDGQLLTKLDVSANSTLEYLICSNNQLSNLNLSTNTALEMLNCSGNQLTDLDLSNNLVLRHLSCSKNSLNRFGCKWQCGTTSLILYLQSISEITLPPK